MDTKEKVAIIGQIFDAFCIIIPKLDLQESEAVKLSGFYPIWENKAYPNGTWLRWKTNEDGKPLLWSTTKNVPINTGAPDVTPGSYRLIG